MQNYGLGIHSDKIEQIVLQKYPKIPHNFFGIFKNSNCESVFRVPHKNKMLHKSARKLFFANSVKRTDKKKPKERTKAKMLLLIISLDHLLQFLL